MAHYIIAKLYVGLWHIAYGFFKMVDPPRNNGFEKKKHVCPNSDFRYRNNTPQYHILVTRGWTKTLAIRSDFDFRFQDLGFKVVGFRVSLFCEHVQIDKISKHNQPFLGPNSSSNDLTNSPDGPLVLSPGLWIASGFMLVASPFFDMCVCTYYIYTYIQYVYIYTVYTHTYPSLDIDTHHIIFKSWHR